MTTLILLLMLTAPVEPTWLQGHLISITRTVQPRTAIGSREEITYTLAVEITENAMPMIVEAIGSPRKPPHVVENDSIPYRVDGHKLFVKDKDGKEIKLSIIKTRKP